MARLLFRECGNPTCRLRYPVRADEPRVDRCPACGAAAEVVAVAQAGDEQPALAGADALPRLWLAGLLDNVRSLFNVGSIFRSADGAGFDHLYLCGITPTPANRKLAKTALGAEASVAWSSHRNSLDLAQQLLGQGAALWALEEGEGAASLLSPPPITRPIVLVAGNELAGVDPGLLALCEHRLAIPMRGRKRSLNVATAFGVAAVLLSEQLPNSHNLFAPS